MDDALTRPRPWGTAAVMAAMLVTGGLWGIPVTAAHAATQTVVVDGMTFSYDDTSPTEQATLTGYDRAFGSEVVIPEEIQAESGTLEVTTIGDSAFRGSALTTVTIPHTVTHIAGGAFRDNLLTTVALPEGLVSIGMSAFAENQLSNLHLPSGLTELLGRAFYANALTSIDIPPGLTSISNNTFAFNRLTDVTIPEGVTSIDDFAFSDNMLTSLSLPDTLTHIGHASFMYNRLPELNIPTSVTTIEETAFAWNNEVMNVWFEGDAPEIQPVGVNPNVTGSFGDDPVGKILFYRCAAAGFTSPEWMGYATERACHDVTFNSNGGTPVPSQEVDAGAQAVEPPAPIRQGHVFAGWHADEDLTSNYDFSSPVTSSLTLHARWTIDTHTVTFDSQGGSTVPAVSATHGSPINGPQPPTREGHLFVGWNTDPAGNQPYDFALQVTSSFTLYASWRVDAPPTVPPPPITNVLATTGSPGLGWAPPTAAAAMLAGAALLLARRGLKYVGE